MTAPAVGMLLPERVVEWSLSGIHGLNALLLAGVSVPLRHRIGGVVEPHHLVMGGDCQTETGVFGLACVAPPAVGDFDFIPQLTRSALVDLMGAAAYVDHHAS